MVYVTLHTTSYHQYKHSIYYLYHHVYIRMYYIIYKCICITCVSDIDRLTVSCPHASPDRPRRLPRACRAVDVLPPETTQAEAQTAVCIVSSGIVQLVYYQSVVRMCLYMYARCRPVYMPYLTPPTARALVHLHPCVLWSPSELPAASPLLDRSVRDRRDAHLSCAWGVRVPQAVSLLCAPPMTSWVITTDQVAPSCLHWWVYRCVYATFPPFCLLLLDARVLTLRVPTSYMCLLTGEVPPSVLDTIMYRASRCYRYCHHRRNPVMSPDAALLEVYYYVYEMCIYMCNAIVYRVYPRRWERKSC